MKKLLLIMLVMSCTRKPDATSETNYLTESSYTCQEPTAERIAYVKNLLTEAFVDRSFSSQEREVVFRRLAGIPDKYLQHLVDRFSQRQFKGIFSENLGGMGGGMIVAGLTQLQSQNGSGMYALWIKITPGQTDFALQHEVGHAMQSFVAEEARKKGIQLDSSFSQILREVARTPGVRPYATTDEYESWAESFANFYCSKQSRDFIARMPQTNNLLSQVLEPPMWEWTGNSNNSADPAQLFVALADNQNNGGSILGISAPDNVTRVDYCQNSNIDECKNGSPSSAGLKDKKPGRALFIADVNVTASEQKTFILIGRNDNGDVLYTRQFNAQKN